LAHAQQPLHTDVGVVALIGKLEWRCVPGKTNELVA
jgi:hypothetical protein